MKMYDITSPENANVTDLSSRTVRLAPRPTASQRSTKRWIIIASVMFLLLCAILGAILYFLATNKQSGVIFKTTTTDQAAVISSIGSIINLPTDEKPVVTPVTDVNALKTQAFFVNAKSGDVLVLYVKNHLAVLFDPTVNKIVNMSKVTAVVLPPPSI